MDKLKVFLLQEIEKYNYKIKSNVGNENFKEIELSKICGKIEAYESVLEFLEQDQRDKKHIEHMDLISDTRQQLKEIDSKKSEFQKLKNLAEELFSKEIITTSYYEIELYNIVEELELEFDLLEQKIFNLESDLNESRVINSMRLSKNGTNENYFREGN